MMINQYNLQRQQLEEEVGVLVLALAPHLIEGLGRQGSVAPSGSGATSARMERSVLISKPQSSFCARRVLQNQVFWRKCQRWLAN